MIYPTSRKGNSYGRGSSRSGSNTSPGYCGETKHSPNVDDVLERALKAGEGGYSVDAAGGDVHPKLDEAVH